SGIDDPSPGPPDSAWDAIARRIEGRQVLTYVGRLENGKGCDELVEFFSRFTAEERRGDVILLLLGTGATPIPANPQILAPGYVSEYTKHMALDATAIAVAPSPFESLCLAALESWRHARPLLANGKCPVLVGHCSRSDGGLWYTSYPEFREALKLLLQEEGLRRTLGERGRRYVETRYRWESVLPVYRETLDRIVAAA